MSPQKNQYQAYSKATHTVAKTRQIVMLYDGVIRFLKQAQVAIEEKRIEDRYKLLVKASEIITGLQSAVDFTSGGEVAVVLHRFYTGMSLRILSVNFKKNPEEGRAFCGELIDELKQMRNVWDSIDLTLNTPAGQHKAAADFTSAQIPSGASQQPIGQPTTVTVSA